ncbi:hypothetical protein SmJEL517_g04585 [Synchytrium microbalum]|uniref:protein-tyrosine-phosphatase n=1 Tax=Synchytrium microbalum TaxID=1806994 RepID=A0A507BRC0_9FUNG|nr:uncharacterized protein SmJEL517_g04585 [Synchytrium microbalum]TPX32250.1 hypothetical protein SmJEL517_g04585 [Synchytrium microbalum]
MSISSTVTTANNSNTNTSTIPPITNRSSPALSAVSAPRMPACVPLARAMSPVEFKNMRFLITDCPIDASLGHYLAEFQARGVTDVVRVCEATYDKTYLESNGIKVHDWPFKDGGIPPNEVVLAWLALCESRFGSVSFNPSSSPTPTNAKIVDTDNGAVTGLIVNKPVIAIHCVAGLGRAPVLVAIALIEAGMAPLDCIEYVRRARRGAFNSIQLSFLVDNYKRQWMKKSGRLGISAVGVMMKRSTSPGMDAALRRKSDESNSNSKDGDSSSTGSQSTSGATSALKSLFRLKSRPSSMALPSHTGEA